jgi:hypothetical protein
MGNIDNKQGQTRMKSSKLAALLLAVTALAVAPSVRASVVDLGQAVGFSVLTYNSNNTSDSAFQGAPLIGVVNGDWNQSGGGQTNTQQPVTVMLSPGHTNHGPQPPETTVFDASRLNAAWTDATNASAMLASLTPTQVLGNINSGMTITENTVGHYVLSISNINLNQSFLTLSAPVGSTFVLNISGNITLNGGSQGGLALAGGLTATDVVYNLIGANSNLTTSGGGNAQQINGIVLATGSGASVNLHPGQINGEVIATTFTTSSGALVFGTVPEVTPSSVIFGFLGLIVAVSSRRVLSRRMQPVAARGSK